jgi:TP901-1 family phage major tail protein
MAAQRGKDLLLKADATGEGNFTTIAGLRARSIDFNTATVDITHADSVGEWRELLTRAGVKSAKISGSGLFKDADSDALMRELCFEGAIHVWQMIIPDFGTIEGPFQITSLQYSGSHDNELTFEVSLESAGELTFTATE